MIGPRILDASNPEEWAHPLNRGLIAEWAVLPAQAGWETRTLRDLTRGGEASPGSNDCNLTGTLPWGGSRGRPGGQGAIIYAAAGGNYYQSASATLNPSTTDFTTSAWFYTTTYTITQDILSQIDGGGTGRTWMSVKATGLLRSNIGGVETAGATTLAVNTHYHFTLTCISNTITLYYNAVSDASAARTPDSNLGAMRLGTAKTGTGGWNGALDGWKMWTRGFTPTQVRQLYEEERLGNPNRWRWYTPRTWVFGGTATSPPPPPATSLGLVGAGLVGGRSLVGPSSLVN